MVGSFFVCFGFLLRLTFSPHSFLLLICFISSLFLRHFLLFPSPRPLFIHSISSLTFSSFTSFCCSLPQFSLLGLLSASSTFFMLLFFLLFVLHFSFLTSLSPSPMFFPLLVLPYSSLLLLFPSSQLAFPSLLLFFIPSPSSASSWRFHFLSVLFPLSLPLLPPLRPRLGNGKRVNAFCGNHDSGGLHPDWQQWQIPTIFHLLPLFSFFLFLLLFFFFFFFLLSLLILLLLLLLIVVLTIVA